MTTSLYLNPQTWDLVSDVNGNIAVASQPYAAAQDAATQIKEWISENFYDETQGVNWPAIFGSLPPLSYVRSQLMAAAKLVPGVLSAAVFFTSFSARLMAGQVQTTTEEGTAFVSFAQIPFFGV